MTHDLPSPGRFAKRLGVAVAFAAVFVALLWFPSPASDRFLDQGYGLAYAWFLKTGKQAGVDYAFTYGPLGYLVTGSLYFPGLYALKVAWALGFGAVAAWLLVRLATHLPLWLAVVWVALVLALLPRSETQFLVIPVVAALLIVIEGAWSARRIALTTLLLALIALGKFTFLVLASCLVAVLAYGAPRARRFRTAAAVVGAYVAWLAVLWLVAGQSLRNVPRYLALSWELAHGYSEAMSLHGSDAAVTHALWTFAGLGVAALCVPFGAWRSRRRRAGLLLVAPGLFLAWKEGFVRQDPQHARVLFGYAALAALCLVALDRGRRLTFPRTTALAAVALLWISGRAGAAFETTWMFAAENFHVLTGLREHAVACDRAWREQQQKWNLPEVRARVGDASIDVLSFDQNMVFWNDFNWQPRPIFQGYSAYTPWLARLNGEFFRVPAGPRYALVRWSTIDHRFPAQDDGLALIELFRRYRPVLEERDYILLERRPIDEVAEATERVVIDRSYAFGDVIHPQLDVRELCTLQARFHPTTLGRLWRLVFRMPRPLLDVQQTTREQKRYELVAGLGPTEFVLSPLVEGNIDFPRVYAGGGRGIAAFRFSASPEIRAAFADRVDVVVRCYPGVAAGK